VIRDRADTDETPVTIGETDTKALSILINALSMRMRGSSMVMLLFGMLSAEVHRDGCSSDSSSRVGRSLRPRCNLVRFPCGYATEQSNVRRLRGKQAQMIKPSFRPQRQCCCLPASI